MSDLVEGVWPQTAERVDGVLHLGGIDVRALAAEHGTPLLVLDEDDLRARCRAWRTAFEGWPSGAATCRCCPARSRSPSGRASAGG